ncbi:MULTISPECIES: alpha/beta fold hydrolase [Shewanella]|uniref:Alpha/beta hydrolase n=1 Tax=Shewanella holmiensis TaxID=2952222 RepID=A0A9X2WM14_9GAMM|nr:MULTISPECIES: alpha/beta hydrolase [Shewanella]MCT7941397.1 alpha/beta hydrolase [Shewanella holmiensis]MDP5145334.1 alpha/beta hydrolase [Shewanella sp. ULN5]
MLSNSKQGLIDQQPLHYTDNGQGDVIVLLHGLFADKHIWQAQVQYLSEHYRCIAIDLWGHGDNKTIPAKTRNLIDVATHITQLLADLEIAQYHIVGHGCGAAIAAEMVLQQPSKVKSLVMLNAFIGFEPEVNCVKYQQWLDVMNQTKTITKELANTISTLMFAKGQQDINLVNQLSQQLSNIDSQQIPVLSRFAHMAIYKRDTMELVEQLTLPTLVIIGVENQLRTVLESYLMSDDIDGASLHHLADAGHLAMVEQPEQINTLLHHFYQQQ